ncbi:MAG: ABC-type amino acid transport [Candidatus Magnetoglobus multicellularis str. Araruama]|uniref:ABC-type amino acid transport n=1 Tax=Candidatus Magnetoglobus multicellularis str. Araruama TaxID=890399 RepID=A0A1V1P021_9BACT|nr:MAG: ABC-type amino acid transport [Candidatus Magnetoglobus multicellularis str. Araruama]
MEKDLKGLNVGVYGPSNTSQSLLKIKTIIKDMRVDFSPDSSTCFQKLSRGEVDAVYSNKAVGQCLINRYNIKNIRYAGRDKSLEYYLGFNQKYTNKTLVDKFNTSFEKFHKAGVIKEILSMYGMSPAEIK